MVAVAEFQFLTAETSVDCQSGEGVVQVSTKSTRTSSGGNRGTTF